MTDEVALTMLENVTTTKTESLTIGEPSIVPPIASVTPEPETQAISPPQNRNPKKRKIMGAPTTKPDITLRSYRKKVSGKITQNLWTPLSQHALAHINRALEMYMDPALVQTNANAVKTPKKKLLTANKFIRETVTKLQAELAYTNLPPISSNGVGSSYASIRQYLDLDLATRKNHQLSTVYSADLRQVALLEKELLAETLALRSDEDYFNLLSKLMKKSMQEMNDKLGEHRFLSDGALPAAEVTDSVTRIGLVTNSHDPSDALLELDKDFVSLVSKLVRHVGSIERNVNGLEGLDRRLELVNELLDMA
ncbi:hypothetical protein BABINDRAFT_159805 [Babjeviella inositovora NRRL Y-12698]|uniref:Uncharacterized protein n=1 Tax=Babjeviella inositovora NRRL Y-12698 TaxID=984486 RepID=A0A1E3QV41_9ASCO|nr:uncharacterized protein BABINDRAFT_159805 [Babjeviella inositovora NRRL Y-12698]ODQ81525.1 hypothetical protein BABINDRAFT_159805 [Babjeviella inositovora NRRL Y-12698]